MYIVVESYDGEVNVVPCSDIKSARFIMNDFKSTIEEINYEIITNKENYFEAEIHEMLYVLEIREKDVFSLENK